MILLQMPKKVSTIKRSQVKAGWVALNSRAEVEEGKLKIPLKVCTFVLEECHVQGR